MAHTNAAGQTVGESLADPMPVGFGADAVKTRLAAITVTLSGTPNTPTVITLPDWAQGFRLYPASNDIVFAVGEAPATLATSSSSPIAATAFSAGGIAKADQWETRIIQGVNAAGTGRTLQLLSGTASVVVGVTVF